MSKLSKEAQEKLAQKIARVVEGEAGFVLVGNKGDKQIETTLFMQGIPNGELAVAVIQALHRPFGETPKV